MAGQLMLSEEYVRDIEAQGDLVKRLVSALRELLSHYHPKGKPEITIQCSDDIAIVLCSWRDAIESLVPIKLKYLGSTAPPPDVYATSVLDSVEIYLDLVDIDMTAELDRLRKELAKVTQRIESSHKTLSNENFVSKAPPDVVSKHRDTLAESERVATLLTERINELEQMRQGDV